MIMLTRHGSGRKHPEVSGHPQVDDEPAVIAGKEQIFPPAAHLPERAAWQQIGQFGRNGKTQLRYPDDNGHYPRPRQLLGKSPTGYFNFGQFGHDALQ